MALPELYGRKDILILLHNDILQQIVINELQLSEITKNEILAGVTSNPGTVNQKNMHQQNITNLSKTLERVKEELKACIEKEEEAKEKN